jgi:predicted small secreted protein
MRKMRSITLTSALALTALTLAGCGGVMGPSNDRVGEDMRRVSDGVAGFQGRDAIRPGGAQVSDGVFLGATAERISDSRKLPARLEGPNAVSIQSRDPMSLSDIAQRLSEITDIPHLVILGPTGDFEGDEDAIIDSIDMENMEEAAPRSEIRSPASANRSASQRLRVRTGIRGPLSEVLDEVAAAFSVEWSYQDDRIVFRDFVTRQYQVSALPNRSTVSTSIGTGEMDARTALATDVWAEIDNALKGMTSEGASVSLGSGTGLVTVTASLSDHGRISEYFSELNESVGQQISFDVNVLTVSSSDAEGYGINLSSLLEGSDDRISILGSESVPGRVGSVNIGVLAGRVDLDLVVEALSRQGRVSVETRAGATTSNNRVVPIKITDRLAYIKSQELETDSNGNQTRSVQTDEVETGFQLQIFPRILNNREVMVQYTVGLSELRDIQSFGDGADTIQLPQVSETSFEQQAVIRNGQTLILAGFERERTQIGRSGIGDAGIPLFGGGRNATREKVSTVLMITPRILNRRSPVRAD